MEKTNVRTTLQLTLDIKNYSMRIHRNTLKALNDPTYIQLLVNPEAGIIAVKSVQNSSDSGQTYRLTQKSYRHDRSFVLFCEDFLKMLFSNTHAVESGKLYHLSGTLISPESMVVFPMSTLTNRDKENH